MSIFDELRRLQEHGAEALAIATRIAEDNTASPHARQAVLGALILGCAELSRSLSPEGATDKLMRDLGKPGKP